VEVDGTTSISTILFIDIDVESFPPYIYTNPFAKHPTTIVREVPSLASLSCSKLKLSFTINVTGAVNQP